MVYCEFLAAFATRGIARVELVICHSLWCSDMYGSLRYQSQCASMMLTALRLFFCGQCPRA
jgi:hypothetical protein